MNNIRLERLENFIYDKEFSKKELSSFYLSFIRKVNSCCISTYFLIGEDSFSNEFWYHE